ncbi:MAG: type IIL restriction-modification enzyme MmeI, partial [Nostoc sp.]
NVSKHIAFAFISAKIIVAAPHNVFALESDSAFAILQSRIHEIWARFFGSSMKDDLRYTPSDCFETFPFPENWETNSTVETAGKTYYEYRAALMVRNNQGLTDTYNR